MAALEMILKTEQQRRQAGCATAPLVESFMLSDHPTSNPFTTTQPLPSWPQNPKEFGGENKGSRLAFGGARQAKHDRVYRTHIEDCTHGFIRAQIQILADAATGVDTDT